MEKGIYDQAVDEVLRLRGLVGAEIVRRNKGKTPFRMVKMSKEDQMAEYLTMPDEKKAFLRRDPNTAQSFNDYEKQMQDVILKEGQNG